jgi:cell division protein FtsB
MYVQIKDSKTELRSLQRQETKLEAQYQAEQDEAESLEERRVYVQTKKYVEEVAKQIGYVYPDEIIYKPQK